MREARFIPIICQLLKEDANVTAYEPVAISNAKSIFGDKINLSSSARIILASTLAAAITYITTSQLTQPHWIILITGTLIFLATYTVAASLTGAINKTDTQNLKEMLNGLARQKQRL